VIATREPDTGERNKPIVEHIVEQIMWWIEGPDSEPPPSVAAMSDEERADTWARIDAIARRKGEAALVTLAEDLAQWNRDRLTTGVNDLTDPT